MTYIGRFEAGAGADWTVRKLKKALEQMEHSFPDDGRREIPQVAEVFTKIEEALAAANALALLFDGCGTQTVADFLPGPDGRSVNDVQMAERKARHFY